MVIGYQIVKSKIIRNVKVKIICVIWIILHSIFHIKLCLFGIYLLKIVYINLYISLCVKTLSPFI